MHISRGLALEFCRSAAVQSLSQECFSSYMHYMQLYHNSPSQCLSAASFCLRLSEHNKHASEHLHPPSIQIFIKWRKLKFHLVYVFHLPFAVDWCFVVWNRDHASKGLLLKAFPPLSLHSNPLDNIKRWSIRLCDQHFWKPIGELVKDREVILNEWLVIISIFGNWASLK